MKQMLISLLIGSTVMFSTGDDLPQPGDYDFVGPLELPVPGDCEFIGPLKRGMKLPSPEECK